MEVKLDKKTISSKIYPLIPEQIRLRKRKVPLWRIINMIIYKLKTGCQWRLIPVKSFCRDIEIHWNTVYYTHRILVELNVWQAAWIRLLADNKSKLDMSSVQLDGSHTTAKQGGEKVSYQGRKRSKTTNALFLTDVEGNILAMSPCISGRHNDVSGIEKMLDKIVGTLHAATISVEGLFLNADAGFDCQAFRQACEKHGIIYNVDENRRRGAKKADIQYVHDKKLYQKRFAVERTNAWIDSYKTLLIRFEKLARNWEALHYLAFICISFGRLF